MVYLEPESWNGKAQGSYICFLDDDDWVSDNYLAELLSKACDNGIVEANVKQWIRKLEKNINSIS